MKKLLLLACILLLPLFAHAQQKPGTLQQAITKTANDLFAQIPGGAVIAVYDFDIKGVNAKPGLADHLFNEFNKLVIQQDRKFILVDRKNMETVRQELALSLTGEISDETAAAIGKMTGASVIITGSLVPINKIYRLTVLAKAVEKNVVIDIEDADIRDDDPQLRFYLEQKSIDFRFAAGFRPGASLHYYKLTDDISGSAENPSIAFEPAFQAAFYFSDFFGLQTEIVLSCDKTSYSGNDPDSGLYTASFESFSLRLPVLVRFTYRPGIFQLSAFAGISFNIPLGAMKTYSSLFDAASYRFSVLPGYIAGTNLGIKLGSGFLFADMRFSGDFTRTAIHDDSGTLAIYTRNTLSFSLGYEFEFQAAGNR